VSVLNLEEQVFDGAFSWPIVISKVDVKNLSGTM
jgi:hypothetical protein